MRGGSSPAATARKDVDGLVGKRLCFSGVEGDHLVVERLAVLVQGAEQRGADLHVGHVDLDLREVERLCGAKAALDDVVPGFRVESLVFPQRRPGDADVGPGDNHAVDMAAQPPAGRCKPELAAVAALRPEIEPAGAEPLDRQRLETVSGFEHPQHGAVEVVTVIR
jgi:hypothetical protein